MVVPGITRKEHVMKQFRWITLMIMVLIVGVAEAAGSGGGGYSSGYENYRHIFVGDWISRLLLIVGL